MNDLKICWGVQTDALPSKIRAFVRILTPSGQVMAERVSAFRLMSGDEYAYLKSDAEDAAYEYQMARPFFPAPETIEGVSEAAIDAWLKR